MRFVSILFVSLVYFATGFAQQNGNGTSKETKLKVSAFDGVVVAGYIHEGGFLNFTGPHISFSKGNTKLILGMLPSLRYKEDHSTPRNAPVTPNLGAGLTLCYKKIALQLPLYYDAKTATRNGQWHVGAGIGMRFSAPVTHIKPY